MNKSIQLSNQQMALAYLYVLLVLLICYFRQIHREKMILAASLRMSLQMTLSAFILSYILNHPSPWLSLLVFAVMEAFVIFHNFNRIKAAVPPGFRRAVVSSLLEGSSLTFFFLIFAIVRPRPWYDPQYFIPLCGMFLGNAMTAMGLAIQKLTDDTRSRWEYIEGSLMLGARPEEAMKPLIDDAFNMAILPTLKSMLGMGIVHLPGMMTGQILAGASPLSAIKYQIMVILCMLATNSLCVILFMVRGSRSYFNERDQLLAVDPEKQEGGLA